MILLLSCLVLLLPIYADASENIKTKDAKRGEIALLKNHYDAKPIFYDLNVIPFEKITNNISMQFIMGTQFTVIRWKLNKAGVVMPVHFHVNEQINFVEQGELEVYSEGKKYRLTKGQVIVFPPNVPHEFVAMVDDTIFIDIQTPTRQDFLSADFYEKLKNIFNKANQKK